MASPSEMNYRDDRHELERMGLTYPAIWNVEKRGQITLLGRNPRMISFFYGQMGDCLVSFEDCPKKLYYYKHKDNGLEQVWRKDLPVGHDYKCFKHISQEGEIYLQLSYDKVGVYDRDLEITNTLFTRGGDMIGLLDGGKLAVMDDRDRECRAATTTRLSLYVAPVTDLKAIHHRLDDPPTGYYTTNDVLTVCGRTSGRVAVCALKKPFVDVYTYSGYHECRTELPDGAGPPQCSSTYILVSLFEQPKICVLGWLSGQLLHTFDHTQLHLQPKNWGTVVSPVQEGRFSVWVTHTDHQVHTYQIV